MDATGDMKQIQAELLDKRERARVANEEARAEIDTLVAALQGNCDHSQTRPYVWESDNGYGRQTTFTGAVCTYCGWTDRFNDGRWVK